MNAPLGRLGLALLLVVAGATALPADPGDDETHALQQATQSYRDGAFDLCNDRVAALLKKYPKTELLPQAELLQAQALYQLGRSAGALAAFTLPVAQVPADLQSDTLFWQGEILLDLGRWTDAEQKYRAVLALPNNPPERQHAANLGLAWALFKEGRESEATPLLAALGQAGGPAAQEAQLLQAKIEIAHSQFKDAVATLQALLAAAPAPRLAFEADYWLGEAFAANGQYDDAAAAYKKVTGDLPSAGVQAQAVEAFPKSLVARAYLGLGRAEGAVHQDDQAMLAYGLAFPLIENGADQMQAFRDYLESARLAHQLPDAIARLQDFAKTSSPAAPAALLAIGTVLAEDHQDDRATGILESELVAYGKSSWIPAVDYQLGVLYARAGRAADAVRVLQNCVAAAGVYPNLVRTARFELGLVLLNQAKDPAGAAAQFAQLSSGDDALAEAAAYNALLAQAALNKPDLFLKAEADFEKRFPQSGYLKKIALAEGQLLAQDNRTDEAKDAYERAIALHGGGPDQEALLQAYADLQYATGDLAGTVKTCEEIVRQFPDHSLLAAQRAILVSYEMKKLTDDQAEQQLVALAQKYDKSPDAPEAWFRLGEFYFYRQDYVKAQDAFQQLTAAYPGSSYADNAYFFAGRAAVAHNDYAAALSLLDKVPDDSPFKPDAQLWEGRVYQQQLNFAQATTQADTVLATEKTGPHFVAANLLKGECLFEMGAKNPSNYPEALAAFEQILKNPAEGTVTERNHAAVAAGKCLEKMGRTDEAMGQYLDVLYDRVGANETPMAAPTGFSWQIEAGWQASRIREAQQDWRGAIEIYQRMEQIGGPHRQEFHDLQNKLRRDNYIYE